MIGAYTILTVNDGKLSLAPFRPIQQLKHLLFAAPRKWPDPPSKDFVARYDRFGGQSFWLNINMTADAPSAAVAMERLYAAVEGEELDGTILADPFAYAALLSVTGPVDVPTAGTAIAAENAVAFLSNEAFVAFPDPGVRKAVLGETARVVLERFLQEGAAADPVGAARALIQAAADGHMILHSASPEEQEAFVTAGIAGHLRDAEGDYIGVFSNNAAANKTDFYLDTAVRHHVELKGDGSAESQTVVELRNTAPTEGLPAYVIGPYNRRFVAGENRTYVSTYYAPEARLESFEAPGEEIEVIGSQEELGHPVFSTFVDTLSGETSRLEFNSTLEDAWQDVEGSGRYTLMYQGQSTIRPVQLELVIELPIGASLISSSPPVTPEGDRIVWRGAPGQELRFELAFEAAGISPLATAILAGLGLLLAGLVTLWVLRGRMVRRARPTA